MGTMCMETTVREIPALPDGDRILKLCDPRVVGQASACAGLQPRCLEQAPVRWILPDRKDRLKPVRRLKSAPPEFAARSWENLP
jgi:hypothetical protein